MSDERLKKSADVGREGRETVDRTVTEDRVLAEDERVDMFRQQFHQSALPDLPQLPGYHTCWITTANPRDSVQSRMRLGYQMIREAEIPGWEYASIKTGEYSGFIQVNEMLACKIPETLYQRYMHENHRAEPDRQEQMLADNTEQFRSEIKKRGGGGDVFVGDGNEGLKEQRGRSQFR